jgi:hypothetical protein
VGRPWVKRYTDSRNAFRGVGWGVVKRAAGRRDQPRGDCVVGFLGVRCVCVCVWGGGGGCARTHGHACNLDILQRPGMGEHDCGGQHYCALARALTTPLQPSACSHC